MEIIERVLSGEMEMCDFIAKLYTDSALQNYIADLVPVEARYNMEHELWRKFSYFALETHDFNLYRYLLQRYRLDNSLGDNLNVASVVYRFYSYRYQEAPYPQKYADAFGLYLDAAGEYFEGPEVVHLIERIVTEALLIRPKSDRRRTVKQKLAELFHVEGRKYPRWIQGPEWPMGKNSPMQFVGRKKINDGVEYHFTDVDTREIRIVVQYY